MWLPDGSLNTDPRDIPDDLSDQFENDLSAEHSSLSFDDIFFDDFAVHSNSMNKLLHDENEMMDHAGQSALLSAMGLHSDDISDQGLSLGFSFEDNDFSNSIDSFVMPSYTFIGSIKTHISDHLHYCPTIQKSKASCDCFPCIATLDFQVEQEELLGKCQCSHKCQKWISVRWFSNFAIVGKLSQDLSDALCELVLSGFARLSGEMDTKNRMEKKDYRVPFIITIEMNLDFLSSSIETISTDQLTALTALLRHLKANNPEHLPQRSFFEELVSSIEPISNSPDMLCDSCSSNVSNNSSQKRSRSISDQDYRKKRKHAGSKSSTDDVKSLLEKRRRKRAMEQLSNCSSESVPMLKDAIQDCATQSAEQLKVVIANDILDEHRLTELSLEIDACLDHIVSGHKPLVSIGRLLGFTKVLVKERKSALSPHFDACVKHWHEFLQGNVSPPLAKEIVKMLLSVISKDLKYSDRAVELSLICSMILNR